MFPWHGALAICNDGAGLTAGSFGRVVLAGTPKLFKQRGGMGWWQDRVAGET